MLEIASFPEPTPLLFIKDFTFFGSKILPQFGIFEELLKSVGEFASFLVGAKLIFEKVAAELNF